MFKGSFSISGNMFNDDWRGFGWLDYSKIKKRAWKDIKDKMVLGKLYGKY